MQEKKENAVSSNEISMVEDEKAGHSAKTTAYLSVPMLLLIFKYLSVYDLLLRVGLVCKSWYHVARDRELWMTVDLTKQQKLKPRDLLKLLSFSKFRISDLHLPFRTQEGCFSVHEERLFSLLLRKCQCLRVLQLCRHCWRTLSTDDIQEANSSLEIKFQCCTDHSRLGRPWTCHNLLSDTIVNYRSVGMFQFIYVHHRIPVYETTFWNRFTDHNKTLMERRIILQDRVLEEQMQDISKSSNPKPSLQPYSNITRQARKCPRQKHELRPPANIMKQTKMYHQPRKGQIKRSRQKCIKQ